MTDFDDDVDLIPDDESDSLDAQDAALDLIEGLRTTEAVPPKLADQSIFQTLFMQAVEVEAPDDPVLLDFARYVVGPLSDEFGMTSAKGGAFFRQKAQEGVKVEHVQHDQTMRAHLLNGMLPARRVARTLRAWGAAALRDWDDTTERLFIAGYMLHDYTKIAEVKAGLITSGFKEMEAPSERQIDALEDIFRRWCSRLGLDAFLQPVGGVEPYLHELIYIAQNTQQLWGTAHAPVLFNRLHRHGPDYMTAATVSRLADLTAYSRHVHTPRALVASESINSVMLRLTEIPGQPGQRLARLTYHHVAENRGVLLNFIHNAALKFLTTGDADGKRIPLLYAPSGVVYLEHRDAPRMPDPAELIPFVVDEIRRAAGDRLIKSGKGAKRGNVGLLVDDSYADFFDLRELVSSSVQLVSRYVRNNKSPERLAPVVNNGWPGGDNIPPLPPGAKDAQVDQVAEWAGLMETQFRDRMEGFDLTQWLLDVLGVSDLRPIFDALKDYPEAKKGGIKYWWFWAASHSLARQPGIRPDQVIEGLMRLSSDLAAALPAELPASAQMNTATWEDLTDYLAQVLTLGGVKAPTTHQNGELVRYTRAKAGRGGAVCAICGSEYRTRKPTETAVAFQPGVYTARIKIGGSDNKRSLCSICALEQLLRQLFVENLDTGGTAEGQRIRYLSFYPSYFFTPETLRLMRRVYGRIKSIRLGDRDLRRALETGDLADPKFWQRLEPFLLRAPDEEPSRRVLRYAEETQPTYLTVGLRSFNEPTDTESWILPAFMALGLSVCLDVKVVASESGVPLLAEADELPETVWLDGAHAAIRALVGDRPLDIDQIMPALVRLTTAYLIHLDTEGIPRDEHWNRFVSIANSLAESPLYVFYHLKRQERSDKHVHPDQVRRYVGYTAIFSEISHDGGNDMHRAKELVRLYSQFYRAKRPFQASSYTLLRPVDIVADTLLNADRRLFDEEEALIDVARGQLHDRLESSETNAVFIQGRNSEEQMRQFCTFFVHDIFLGVFKGDVAALRGKQLNLLRSACEVIYLDEQRKKWAERDQDPDAANADDEMLADAEVGK